MDTCCDSPPEPGRGCPECGAPARTVDLLTVKAMLLPGGLATLSDRELRFCAAPGCPVVYFGSSDRFGTDQLGVAVFQKEAPGARTVCYCFAIGEEDIADEIATTGCSTVTERVSGLVKAGRCACEIKNPQGSCCLANVASVARAASSGSHQPSGTGRDGDSPTQPDRGATP